MSIMLRNGRALALTLATLVMAGCAQSDYMTSRNNQTRWHGVDRVAISKASRAVPPKILPETHFAAAQLFEAQGLFGKAITQYRKAVAVNHLYADAYHRLGVLLGRVGRHREAIAALNKAAELRPDDPILKNNFGFQLMLNGQWADSEHQFRRAIELDPRFARAYVNLGMVLSKLDRFDEALASFLAVLPEPDAYYNLGLTLRGHREYQRAADAFNRVLAIDPDFTAATVQLEQMAGRWEHAYDSEAFTQETQKDRPDDRRPASGTSAGMTADASEDRPSRRTEFVDTDKALVLQAIEQMFLRGADEVALDAQEPRGLMKASIIDDSVSQEVSGPPIGFEELQFTPFDYDEWFNPDFEPCPDEYFDRIDPFYNDAIDWMLPQRVEEPGVAGPGRSISSLIGAGSVIDYVDEKTIAADLPFPPPLAMMWTDPDGGPWTDEPIVETLVSSGVIGKEVPHNAQDPIAEDIGFAIADVGERFDIPFRLDDPRPTPLHDSYQPGALGGTTVANRQVLDFAARPYVDHTARTRRASAAARKAQRPVMASRILKTLGREAPIDRASAMKHLEAELDAVRQEMDCWEDVARERREERKRAESFRMNSSTALPSHFVPASDLEFELDLPAPPGVSGYFATAMFQGETVNALPTNEPSTIVAAGRPLLASEVWVEPGEAYLDDADVDWDVIEHLPTQWDPTIGNVEDLASIVRNEVDCRSLAEAEKAARHEGSQHRKHSSIPASIDHFWMRDNRSVAQEPTRLQK